MNNKWTRSWTCLFSIASRTWKCLVPKRSPTTVGVMRRICELCRNPWNMGQNSLVTAKPCHKQREINKQHNTYAAISYFHSISLGNVTFLGYGARKTSWTGLNIFFIVPFRFKTSTTSFEVKILSFLNDCYLLVSFKLVRLWIENSLSVQIAVVFP